MPMMETCCICQQKTSSETVVDKTRIGSPPILVSDLLLLCFESPEKLKKIITKPTKNFLCNLCVTSLIEFYEATQSVALKRNEFLNRMHTKSASPDPIEYFVIIESTNEDSNSSNESIKEQYEHSIEEYHLEISDTSAPNNSDEEFINVHQPDEEFVKVHQPDEEFEDDWSSDWSNEFEDTEATQRKLIIEREPKTQLRFCWRCDQSFPSDDAFEIHIKLVHTKGKKLNFLCQKCKKCFGSKRERSAHISSEQCYSAKSYQPSINQSQNILYDEFTCSICSKTMPTQRSFQRHMALHKKHTCAECGNVFNSKDFLQKHMVMHQDDRNFVCPVCDFKFRTAWNLKRHQKLHCLGDISRNSTK